MAEQGQDESILHRDLNVGRCWGGKELSEFEDLSKMWSILKEANQRLKDAIYIAPSPKNGVFPPQGIFFFSKMLSNF